MDKDRGLKLLGLREDASHEEIERAFAVRLRKLQSKDYADDPEYVRRKIKETREAYQAATSGAVKRLSPSAEKKNKDNRFDRADDFDRYENRRRKNYDEEGNERRHFDLKELAEKAADVKKKVSSHDGKSLIDRLTDAINENTKDDLEDREKYIPDEETESNFASSEQEVYEDEESLEYDDTDDTNDTDGYDNESYYEQTYGNDDSIHERTIAESARTYKASESQGLQILSKVLGIITIILALLSTGNSCVDFDTDSVTFGDDMSPIAYYYEEDTHGYNSKAERSAVKVADESYTYLQESNNYERTEYDEDEDMSDYENDEFFEIADNFVHTYFKKFDSVSELTGYINENYDEYNAGEDDSILTQTIEILSFYQFAEYGDVKYYVNPYSDESIENLGEYLKYLTQYKEEGPKA